MKDQKYKGRGVLRGDIVKDHSGANAVFTEQGSSASQTTAAKVLFHRKLMQSIYFEFIQLKHLKFSFF